MNKVLITGGAGFLGRYVVQHVKERGGIPIVPRKNDYDLRCQTAVRQLFRDHDPEIVIHLAAHVGGIGLNQQKPAELFYDNAIMGLNLIHEACAINVSKFVTVGTACSYPKLTPVPFLENDLFNGYPEETNAPYGIAKRSLMVMGNAYREQYGFNHIYIIPVNLYGPGDNFDLDTSHVIPALIRKFTSGTHDVVLWGNGSATREFLYVNDAARAIVTAAVQYDSSLPLNIGSGQEISIRELAGLIKKLCASESKISWDTSKPNGQPRRCLDSTRAQSVLKFTATTSLQDGLNETIRWWKSNG